MDEIPGWDEEFYLFHRAVTQAPNPRAYVGLPHAYFDAAEAWYNAYVLPALARQECGKNGLQTEAQ